MKLFLLAVLAALPLAGAYAAPEDELLEADAAFALSTRAIDAHTLEASWKIAPGYYMYRDKFKFEALDNNIKLKAPLIPAGKKKNDPLFGITETYVNAVTVRVPIALRSGDAQVARIRITAQGCNEPIGVCYPPMQKEIGIQLAAVDAAPAKPITSLKELAQSLDGGTQQEVVDPEKAFRLTITGVAADALRARFDIADCCYLYRDKTRFELTNANGVRLGAYTLPAGKKKVDEFVGTTEVYDRSFDVQLPLQGAIPASGSFILKATYQGCSEKGVAICYPPTTKSFDVAVANGVLVATPTGTSLSSGTPAEGSAPAPATPAAQPFLIAVLFAFGAGLLLTFTPCVLPMIPILSSIVVGSGEKHLSKVRGGLLSYAYVLGTAVTFTIAGAVAGATGEQLQAYFQNPWAIGFFSVILVLLALSMFGFYELQMPSFVQSRLQDRTRALKGGSFVGVFFIGMFSALIIGACVTPVLVGILSAAILSQDPVLGGAMMFALAHGQGVILVAMGVGAGYLLPKAGLWMDRVKYVFGVLLLAVAIYLLGYLPQVPVLFLWAALFIVTAVYLGATQTLPKDAGGWQYLIKGLGTLLLVWGVAALVGGFAGNRDILSPIALPQAGADRVSARADSGPAATESLFEPVKSLQELEGRLAEAKAAGKPAILDYYATWCTDCVRMEKSTFRDARVRQALKEKFVTLQADVTDPNHPESKAIKRRFTVYGPPAMLFFAADGTERRELRTYGYKSADAFLALIGKL